MNPSRENLLQILESLNVPIAFLGVMLTMLLALTLAPFLGGFKVGPVEVPKLPPWSRKGLLVGTLVAWVVMLVPVWPVEKTLETEPPCLLTAKAEVGEVSSQQSTLEILLRHFQLVMADHDVAVQVEYDEGLLTAKLPQHRFAVDRIGGVDRTGCQLLGEIAAGLNRSLVQQDDPHGVTIFASCDTVFIAPRGMEPPPGDFVPCS